MSTPLLQFPTKQKWIDEHGDTQFIFAESIVWVYFHKQNSQCDQQDQIRIEKETKTTIS